MAVESHDKKLDDLLKMVDDGKVPLCFWLMVVSKSDSAIGSLKA